MAGWRAIFLINMPVGVLAIAAGVALLSEHRERAGTRLDGVAAAMLSGGLVPAVLAVTWLPQRGLSPSVVVAASTAVLLLAAFAVRERRSSAPLIELALLRRIGVRTGTAALALSAQRSPPACSSRRCTCRSSSDTAHWRSACPSLR